MFGEKVMQKLRNQYAKISLIVFFVLLATVLATILPIGGTYYNSSKEYKEYYEVANIASIITCVISTILVVSSILSIKKADEDFAINLKINNVITALIFITMFIITIVTFTELYWFVDIYYPTTNIILLSLVASVMISLYNLGLGVYLQFRINSNKKGTLH